jgi:plasmid maintenance system antidote protein VapI
MKINLPMNKYKNKDKLFAEVDKIQARITKIGISQRRIAADLEINETSLSYYLNKRREYVTDSMTKRLKEYLDKKEA